MNKLSNDNSLKEGDISNITTYQAGILQAATHRILQKKCDVILKPYGLSKVQWLLIGAVLDAGKDGIRLTDLSKTLDTTISFITVAVNLLVAKGILSRTDSESDSRSKLVTVNESFMDSCEEIEGTLREALRKELYANITRDELKTYMKVLYLITESDKSSR
jgi:DNA-binding MarR family transcriptional regulator